MDADWVRDFNDGFNEVIEEQRIDLRMATIAARRQHIEDTAKCVDCGTDQKTCQVLGAGQTGPGALCCWRGDRHHHERDQKALDTLFDEVARGGTVRTVAEVDPPPVLGPLMPSNRWLLHQNVWWYPHRRPALRIAAMEKPYRYNTTRLLERRAPQLAGQEHRSMAGWLSHPLGPGGDMATDAFEREMDDLLRDPLGWLHERPLMRALRRGLPTGGKKLAALQARAAHWSTCPMRLTHPGALDRCVCIREGSRVVGATNTPAGAR